MNDTDVTQGDGGDPNDVLSRPLPPGIHPMDLGEAVSSDFGLSHPAPSVDTATKSRRGRPAFGTENKDAISVFERASSEAGASVIQVNADNGGTALGASRQKGRTRVTIAVPSTLADGVTVPNGVTFGFSEGDVQNVGIWTPVLNPGDSLSLGTEAPVWLGLIAGKTTGTAMVIVEINPVIGGID